MVKDRGGVVPFDEGDGAPVVVVREDRPIEQERTAAGIVGIEWIELPGRAEKGDESADLGLLVADLRSLILPAPSALRPHGKVGDLKQESIPTVDG